MNKLNITKIIFIPIDCSHCNKQFKVYCNGEWSDIKEMKLTDERLLFSCPFCDHTLADETDFSSICRDEDADKMALMRARVIATGILSNNAALNLYNNQVNIGYNYEEDKRINSRMYGTKNNKEGL